MHLILGKAAKFLVEKLSTSEVISQKPHGGKTPSPSAFTVKNKKVTGKKQIGGGKQPPVLIVLNNEKTRFTGMKFVDA